MGDPRTPAAVRRDNRRRRDWLVLALCGLGFPLTQFAIRVGGRPGAVAVQGLVSGLLVRDIVLIGHGALRRQQPFPSTLLVAETTAGLAAGVLGLRMLGDPDTLQRVVTGSTDTAEQMRRIAIGALFGLHTWRFRVDLSPQGRGSRSSMGAEERSSCVGDGSRAFNVLAGRHPHRRADYHAWAS